VPGCAQAAAKREVEAALNVARGMIKGAHSRPVSDIDTVRRLADWWDTWKTSIRKALLTATKHSRQSMTRSYRQRLHRLYERLDGALLADLSALSMHATFPKCSEPAPDHDPSEGCGVPEVVAESKEGALPSAAHVLLRPNISSILRPGCD